MVFQTWRPSPAKQALVLCLSSSLRSLDVQNGGPATPTICIANRAHVRVVQVLPGLQWAVQWDKEQHGAWHTISRKHLVAQNARAGHRRF